MILGDWEIRQGAPLLGGPVARPACRQAGCGDYSIGRWAAQRRLIQNAEPASLSSGATMMVANEKVEKGEIVAGRKTVTVRGLEFRMSPEFWPRRLHLFPFYFESTNPSFRVDVRRVSHPPADDDWPDGRVAFEIVFADRTATSVSLPTPHLMIGQSARLILEDVYTSYPGQTIIRLPVKPGTGPPTNTTEWQTLYSYRVWPEEQLWLWAIGPLIGLLVGVGATVLGVFIQRSLG